MTTPQQLLDHCCRFPACYDPLYQLCLDTCRKCEADFPVTSWLPCPPLLNIPDCTSDSLSAAGRQVCMRFTSYATYIPIMTAKLQVAPGVLPRYRPLRRRCPHQRSAQGLLLLPCEYFPPDSQCSHFL